MKQFKKILALCAIIVFVIAGVFALPACQKDPTVESISVAIVGGGDTLQLEQNEATLEKISEKITVTAHYSDETTEPVTDYTIEGFDKTKLDTVQSLTVKYGELTAPLSVKIKKAVVEVTVTGITVTPATVTLQKSTASEAKLKEALTVKAKKSDNTEETVTNYTLTTLDTTKDTQEITVTYSGKTAKVTVTIEDDTPAPVTVTDITVTPATVTLQKSTASQEKLKEKLTVTAKKSDNTTETVTDYTVTALDTTKATQTVTVTYSGISKSVNVNIEDDTQQVTVTAITVTPTSVTLKKSEADADHLKDKLTVKATKSDETEETVAKANYTVSEIDVDEATQTITVTYSEKTATVTLTIEDDSEQPPVTEKEVSVYLNGEESDVEIVKEPTTQAGVRIQYKAVLVLDVDDVVVIKDADGNKIDFENNAADLDGFEGTVTKKGVYTFYIKLGASNIIWPDYKADAVKSLTTNVTGVLSLPGIKANNIKGSLTVTATWYIAEEPTEVADYKVEGYDKTKLDVEQTVTISYGGASVQIKVKAVEKSAIGFGAKITDDEKDVIQLIGAQATEENILKEVTAFVIYNDGTTKDVTSECTVEGLDLDVRTTQYVKICYGENKGQAAVKVLEPTALRLEVKPTTITVNSADVATVKGSITSVNVVMNDGTKPPVTNYEVEVKEVEGKLVAVITYGTLTANVPVTVLEAQPVSFEVNKTSVEILETLATDDDAILDYVKENIVVTLTLSNENSAETQNYEATYAEGKVTISYDGIEGTKEVTVTIIPVPTISVNGAKATYLTAGANNTYTSGNITITHGHSVVITLADEELSLPDGFVDGKAPRDGTYAFTVTVNGTTATVTCPIPEYTVTLTVTRGAQVVKTEKVTTVDGEGQYAFAGIVLNKNDVIEITDNVGKTFGTYENDFEGTATRNGTYSFYLKSNNKIYAFIPDMLVTITVGSGEPITLARKTDNTAHEEYAIKGLDLEADDVITIIADGTQKTNYKLKNGVPVFSGTADKKGKYDFYVCVDGSSEDGIWVDYHNTDKYGTISVNGGEEKDLELDDEGQLVILELMLEKDDEVVIKVNGEVFDTYKACGFNGTATATGYHDFYVADEGTWVTTAYRKIYYNNSGWDDNWSRIRVVCDPNGANSGSEATRITGTNWFLAKVGVGYTEVKFSGLNDAGWENGNNTGVLSVDTTSYVSYMEYGGAYNGTDIKPEAE